MAALSHEGWVSLHRPEWPGTHYIDQAQTHDHSLPHLLSIYTLLNSLIFFCINFNHELWILLELELQAAQNCLKWVQGNELGFLRKQYMLLTTEPSALRGVTSKGKNQFLSIPVLNLAREQKTWLFCNSIFQQRGYQSTSLEGWYG